MRAALLRLYLPSKGLWTGGAIAGAVTGIQLGMTSSVTKSSPDLYITAMTIGALFAWVIVWRFVDWSVRFSELEALLPVPATDTRLAKTLGMACLLVVPVLTSFAVVATIGLATGLPAGFFRDGASVMLSVTGCLVLAVALRTWLWLSEPGRLKQLALTLLLVVIVIVIGGFLLADPLVGASAAVVGGVLGIAMLRTGPAAPTLAIAPHRDVRSAGPRDGRVSPLTRILARRVLLSLPSAMFLTLLVACQILSMVAGGGYSYVSTLMLVVPAAETSLSLLRVLSHLPISKERLFPWIALPPVCALLLGTTVGFAVADEYRSGELIKFERRDDAAGKTTYELRVPADLWRIATDRPPLVTAPTGETYRPTAYPIGPGSTFVRYNPYEIGNRPDGEFLVYQVSRVLKDCCGIALSLADTRSRFPSSQWDRGIHYWDVGEHGRPKRASDLAFSLLVAVFSSLLILFCVFHRNRPPRDRRAWFKKQVSQWLVPALIVAAGFAIIAITRSWRVTVGGEAPIIGPLWNLVQSSFAAHAVVATLCAAVLAIGLYVVLQRRFVAMEPPGAPRRTPIPGSSLIDV